MGEKKPYIVAFLIQATYAGMVLLSKAAFNTGMNTTVFVFYRQLAGSLFLLPPTIFFERKKSHPLSLAIFCKIFMLGFLGITLPLNIYSIGLVYTSANLGSSTTNFVPITTFAFAVLLRMEKVKIRTIPGIAKVTGVVACMAGVAVLAFYKGPHFKPLVQLDHHLELGDRDQDHSHKVSTAKHILGCFLLFLTSMCWGLWFVLQAQILKIYPSKLAFTTLQCLSSTIQSFVIAIAFKRDLQAWKLAWNFRLLSVLYCGIIVTGITYYLQAWVVSKRDPVFLAATTPLCPIMAIIGSMFLLGEVVNLGSVLGGIVLVISLYSVLWGKSKEQDTENLCRLPVPDEGISSSDAKVRDQATIKPSSLV